MPPVSRANANLDPTDRQLALLRTLHTQHHPGVAFDQWTEQLRLCNVLTRSSVSAIIDSLVARDRRERLANRTPQNGTLPSAPAHVHFTGVESSASATYATPTDSRRRALPNLSEWDGVHIVEDRAYRIGTVARRRWERNVEHNDTSRRRYVWRLVISGGSARWVRLGAAASHVERLGLSAATLATLDQAREFGTAFGFCLNCGRTLVVEQSIERSLGPVCYRRIQAQQARRDAHVLAAAIANATDDEIDNGTVEHLERQLGDAYSIVTEGAGS